MDEEDAQARFEDRLREVAQNLPPASRADLRRLARGLQSEMHAWRLFLLKFEHRSAQEQVSGILRELFGEISVVQAMQFADWIDLELALRETAALDRPIEIPDLDQWLEEYPNPEQAERRLGAWNIQRESCAQHIHVPLLCWLRPRRLSALARRAVDLWSWRHGVYDFCAENGDTDERLAQTEVMQPFSLNFDSRDAHAKRERIVEIKQYLEREGEDAGERLRAGLYAELANLYNVLGEWDEALRINLEEVLPAYIQLNNEAGQAAALNNIGIIHKAQGDYDTALSYLKQSLTIYQQIGDKAGEGATLNNISQIFKAQGDYDTALSYLKQSLTIYQQIGDKAGEGATLNNLATLCHAQGNYDTALSYLKQSLTIRQQIGDKAGEGATLNNISQIFSAQGDYDTALSYLKQSLTISQQIGDKAGEGATLNNISQIYHTQGDYDTALSYLKQSLTISQQIGDKAGEGTTLNNISQIFSAQGDYDTALSYLKQSLTIRQQIGDKAGEGTTLNNLATLCHAQGNYDTALSYLKQSLTIRQQIGDKAREGTTLNNISQIYHAQGDDDTALSCLKQSLTISEQIGDRAGLCISLINQGHILVKIGQVQEAFHAWTAAYQLAKHMHLHNALQALANVASQLGLQADFTGWEKLAANIPQPETNASDTKSTFKN